MARVISIHEYELRRDADGAAFERALRDADMRGLFDLTGLVEHHFLRGFQKLALATVLSPQRRRCRPSSHRSPVCDAVSRVKKRSRGTYRVALPAPKPHEPRNFRSKRLHSRASLRSSARSASNG